MKHLYTLILLTLLIPDFGLAQTNLVPNFSFEDTTHCPVIGDTILCTAWSSYGLSPDYYNSCANTLQSSFGVPQNWMGYQQPLDGNAYIGLLTSHSNTQSPIREFAGAELNTSLSVGARYFVSAYISKAGSYPYSCSSNKFCFRFSNQPYSYINYPPINNFAHVYSDLVISDTAGWTKVQGSFVADSAYRYLILGNFFDDSQTTVADCDTSDLVASYYYIDKVCVSTDSLTCEVTTGIDIHPAMPEISISPNPAQNYITINFASLKNAYDVSIFDMNGRQVFFQQNISSSQTQFDISSLTNGFSLIRIYYNNKFYLYKLLKQ